ncbi:hypothetical protein BDZ89DRAFT_1135448 [Hymenopellis radicata]|nr:hypothetical protein BDZ89DRAFT_1135448 [Hymenopellis radicata]
MEQPPLHPPPRRNAQPREDDIDDAILAPPSRALPLQLRPPTGDGIYAALSFSRTSGLRHGLFERRVELVYEQGRALELKPLRWLAILVLSFVGCWTAHVLYTHIGTSFYNNSVRLRVKKHSS